VHQVGQPCSNHPSLWDLFNRKGAFFPTEFIFWSTPPKMTVLKRPLNSIRRVDPVIYFSVIVFLLSFVSFDVYIRKYSVPAIDPCFSLSSDADALHDAIVSNTLKSEDAQHICSMLNQRNYQEDKHCGSILGHLPSKDAWSLKEESAKGNDPWMQMKWVGKPANCRVKGHTIEALDDVNNFRRGYALKYIWDVEDKTHILPWLLGSRQDLISRNRRVLLDLGGNTFNTSIQWFMRMYPCDFTEVAYIPVTSSFYLPSSTKSTLRP
jgi:hypothetical protein